MHSNLYLLQLIIVIYMSVTLCTNIYTCYMYIITLSSLDCLVSTLSMCLIEANRKKSCLHKERYGHIALYREYANTVFFAYKEHQLELHSLRVIV